MKKIWQIYTTRILFCYKIPKVEYAPSIFKFIILNSRMEILDPDSKIIRIDKVMKKEICDMSILTCYNFRKI